MDRSKKIIESWETNAENWINTIDHAEIESRSLATNDAIIKAILDYLPSKVLDVGCGEGWLTRQLRKNGIDTYGVDAVSSLIEHAVIKDGDYYFNFSYEEIANGARTLPSPFNAVVINFALIDKEATEKLIQYLPKILDDKGLLMIQTLHPLSVAASGDYVSGWKEGSWNGMKRNFSQPYEWYFRTLEDWVQLFLGNGFILLELREPVHPITKKPLSVIFIFGTKEFLK